MVNKVSIILRKENWEEILKTLHKHSITASQGFWDSVDSVNKQLNDANRDLHD